MFILYSLLMILATPSLKATLAGQKAPDFQASAVIKGKEALLSLKDFGNKNKILIFYPADFSFICPTELIALQENIAEFEKRNTIICAISVDTLHSHRQWLETPVNQGGIQGVSYPLIADDTKKISRAYGVLDEPTGTALRGVFILDGQNIIQAASIYNMGIGRSTQELLRVLDAVIFVQENGLVCPANWHTGKKGLEATKQGLKKYLKEKDNNE